MDKIEEKIAYGLKVEFDMDVMGGEVDVKVQVIE
jgi:hypothetical protein